MFGMNGACTIVLSTICMIRNTPGGRKCGAYLLIGGLVCANFGSATSATFDLSSSTTLYHTYSHISPGPSYTLPAADTGSD